MYSYTILSMMAVGLSIPFHGQVESAPRRQAGQPVNQPVKELQIKIEDTSAEEGKQPEIQMASSSQRIKKETEIEEVEASSTPIKAETVIKKESDEMEEVKNILSRSSTLSRQRSQGPSDEQRKDLEYAFSVFDADGDGQITAKELRGILKKLDMDPGSDEEVQGMINAIDQDGNGKVDLDEFIVMMTQTNINDRSDLLRVFNLLDKNHDGFITADELRATNLFKEEDIEPAIDAADENKDGKIDFTEFEKMLTYINNFKSKEE